MQKLFIILSFLFASVGFAVDTKTSVDDAKANRKPNSDYTIIEFSPALKETTYSARNGIQGRKISVLEDDRNGVVCYKYPDYGPSCVKK